MAEGRQGGTEGDAGTKQDAPSQDVSKAGPEVEAAEAKQADVEAKGSEPSADAGRSGAEAGEAPKPKPKRTRKKAADTAAEETGVEKEAAAAVAGEAEEAPKP